MFLLYFPLFYLPSLFIYSQSGNISPVHSNRALSFSLSEKDTPTYCWLDTSVIWDSVRHCGQKRFYWAVHRIIYIAGTLINPLFTNVAFIETVRGQWGSLWIWGGHVPPRPQCHLCTCRHVKQPMTVLTFYLFMCISTIFILIVFNGLLTV